MILSRPSFGWPGVIVAREFGGTVLAMQAVAFSSEVDAGSRQENASEQESGVRFLFNQNRTPVREGRFLRQPKQNQRQRRGRRLHIKYPAAHCRRAVNAGHDHAEQKENLDLEREARSGME